MIVPEIGMHLSKILPNLGCMDGELALLIFYTRRIHCIQYISLHIINLVDMVPHRACSRVYISKLMPIRRAAPLVAHIRHSMHALSDDP